MSITTLYGKWPLVVPMVSQKRRQMAPWCPNGVTTQKGNGPLVSLWCPNAKGKWPHGVLMVSQRRRQMAPWCPYGVSTLKANGPMVSLWCPYSESKWPHGVPLVSLCWKAKKMPKFKSKPKSTLSPSLCQLYVKSMLSTSPSPSLCYVNSKSTTSPSLC
jgi:hypothetical protein